MRARGARGRRGARSRWRPPVRVASALAAALVGLGLAGEARAEGTGQPRYSFDMWAPSLRLGFGVAAHPAPLAPVGFAHVLHLGAHLHFAGSARDPLIFVEPFLGYAFTGRQPDPMHTFVVGLGLAVGSRRIRGVLRPRLLLGGAGGRRLAGLRTGLALEGLMGAIGLEASHQLVELDGQLLHGVQVVVTTDLVAVGLVAVRRWWQG